MKPHHQVKERYELQAFGPDWLILDTETKTVIPQSRGDLQTRILILAIMNLRDREAKCQKAIQIH
jgi:hypothetical protein